MALPSDVVLLVAPVNWREVYTITYSFLTQVLTAATGVEQRLARRRSPRKTVAFTATLPRSKARVFEGQMAQYQGKRFLVPELTLSIRSTAPLAALSQSMAVDDNPWWLVEGLYVVLTSRGFAPEFRTVRGFVNGQIIFSEHTSTVWPSGTQISPGRIGKVQTNFQGSRQTSTVLEVPIQIAIDAASESFPLYDDESFVVGSTFHGREFFEKKPNWATAPSITYLTDLDLIDYNAGVTEYFNPNDLRGRQTQFSFLGVSRDDTKACIDFFMRVRGQQKSFYAPTWTDDLQLAAPCVAGDTSILVEGADVFQAFNNDRVFRNLVFVMWTGLFPFGIRAFSLVGNNTQIELLGPLPDDFDLTQFRMISWLPLCRMSTDALSVAWQTDAVAQFNLTFQTLPDDFDDLRMNGQKIIFGDSYLVFPFENQNREIENRLRAGGPILLINDTYVTLGRY